MSIRPLRILIGANVPNDPHAGAAGTVFHTTKALRELGHHVDEILEDDLERKIAHGNFHYLLELPRRYRDAVADRCADLEYDVIQLSQPYAWLAAREHRRLGRRGVFVNRSHGLELIADDVVPTWHKRMGIPENRFPRSVMTAVLRRLLHRHTHRVVRHSDGIIVPAEDIATFLRDRLCVPRDRVAVIHHGIPSEFVAHPAPPMTEERARRLLYVGQFAFIKGPHIVAEAMRRILNDCPEMTATWVCDSRHHEQVRALLSGVPDERISLRSWMSQEELLHVYDCHGVFLFPSFYEGAGKASLEAMARGMCVVATDVGGMRDYFRHGENGFLVPAGGVEDIASIVDRLARHVELARRVSEAARLDAEAQTWRRCALEATTFYDRLLREKAGSPALNHTGRRYEVATSL